MVYATAPMVLVARRQASSAHHAACNPVYHCNMGVLPMALKGAPANSYLRKFVIKHDKGSRNMAGKDDIVDHSRAAIKRRMDSMAMKKEICQLSKEVWDD